jgi:catechol 2,3-dioxygenase-like lactoylglutathione lyase family enzyme
MMEGGNMLGDNEMYATIAVKDMDRSKQFYGETLGLEAIGEMNSMILFKAGKGKLLVYESEYAGSNKATYANWDVSGIEEIVQRLEGAGVKFEQYDNLPNVDSGGMTRQGAVHKAGNMKSAWFRDPTGNILAITCMEQ